jgi:hypothetical protein
MATKKGKEVMAPSPMEVEVILENANQVEEILDGKVVNICGTPFSVTFEHDLVDRYGILGQVHHFKNDIRLESDASDSITISTLLHEILEVIVRRREIKLEHTDITNIEVDLLGVLQYNTGLLRKILDILDNVNRYGRENEVRYT